MPRRSKLARHLARIRPQGKKIRSETEISIDHNIVSEDARVLGPSGLSVAVDPPTIITESENAAIMESENAAITESENAAIMESEIAAIMESENAAIMESENAAIM